MSSRKTLIQEYFEQKLQERFPVHEVLHMLLFFIDERPGVLVMDPDGDDRELLKSFCKDFGFSYFFSAASKNDRSRLEIGGFFISRDAESLEKLESSEGDFYGLKDRDVGGFLGYPDSAVNYFVEDAEEGTVEAVTKEKVEDLLGEQIPFSEARYLDVVPYVPRPDAEDLEEAVKEGKRLEAEIIDFDRVHDFHTGKTVLSQVFRESIY